MIFGVLPRQSSFTRFFVTSKRPRHHVVYRSIHNGKGTTQRTLSVATPLVFAPKSNSRRSILSLKGTASILEPKWAHLSPCIGAALSTSPLIGNLIKLASLHSPDAEDHGDNKSNYHHRRLFQTATLADHLFFQIMPESSLFLKRTKSAPAAYLTPQLIGTIVGQSIISSGQNKDAIDTSSSIQKYLREKYDIRSNKIGSHWTGVSLNRWMELFRLSHYHQQPQEQHDLLNFSTNNHSLDWMTLSVWSVALWEVSHEYRRSSESSSSKMIVSPQEWCWLEYLIECDAHVQKEFQESIFRKDDALAQGLKRRDSSAMKEWKEQVFCPNQDLNEAAFEKSMDQVLEVIKGNHDVTTNRSDLLQEDWSTALEVICASIAMGHSSPNADTNSSSMAQNDKPVVPNGYFSVDQGDLKADCVEVTIREIIDLLLWNESINALDLSRLPPTASPQLKTFYKRLQQDDTDTDGGLSVFDAGKEWFDILSGLPGCDYLAVGKDQGAPYELAPTMGNVARVCHRLLMQGDLSNSESDSSIDCTNTPAQASEWKSLEDIAHGWTYGPSLYVQSDTLIHRDDTSSSLGEAKEYEIATLQVEGNPNCIEIRMRCDWAQKSGFSAVTHLKESRSNSDSDKRAEELWSYLDSQVGEATNTSFDRIGKLIALSNSTSDLGLISSVAKKESELGSDIELLLLELLAARFGCDRRGIVCYTSQSDREEQLERQREFDRHETKRNRLLLRNALYQICDLHSRDSELCKMLLVCFLQESGDVVESSGNRDRTVDVDERLELMIASLPKEILSSKAIQQAIWNCRSGIIRSKVLAACIELRAGTVSWWDVLLSDFNLREVLSLLSLLRASKG